MVYSYITQDEETHKWVAYRQEGSLVLWEREFVHVREAVAYHICALANMGERTEMDNEELAFYAHSMWEITDNPTAFHFYPFHRGEDTQNED